MEEDTRQPESQADRHDDQHAHGHGHDHGSGSGRDHEHVHDHGHEHDGGHHHHHGDEPHFHDLTIGQVLFMLLMGVLLVLNWRGVFTTLWGVNTAVFIVFIGGFHVFYEAVSALFAGRISAELAVAIAAVAALAIGENVAAAQVIFIMLVGHALEDYAAARAHGSIAALLKLAPSVARVRRDGQEMEIPAEEVVAGDLVIIRPGESIAVDGVVESGRSSVNQATITGESLPASKAAGDSVFAGTINEAGALEVRATQVGADTTLATIVRLVEEAKRRKAPVQRLADRWAAWFVPVVLVIAGGTWFATKEILRAVTVLIVACPCALVLATPTAMVCGLARLARDGVLVKGGSLLEALSQVSAVAFDKTGTLTRGAPVVSAVIPAPGVDESRLLTTAASAERDSEHILGRLLVQTAADRGLAPADAQGFQVLPGRGVTAIVDHEEVLVGSRQLLAERELDVPDELSATIRQADENGETVVLVVAAGRLLGAVAFADQVRAEAHHTVHELRHLGIERIALLTGDQSPAASAMARRADIQEVAAELLPQDKVDYVQRWRREGERVAMLGDGINDAPALATADVGIALGGVGSDLTIESADVVFMSDDLSRLPHTIDISRQTVRMVKQNIIVFAFVLNAMTVAASAVGWLKPVSAAMLHELLSLFVIVNSMRLLLARWRAPRWVQAPVRFARAVQSGWQSLTWRRLAHWWGHHGDSVVRWGRVAVPVLYIVSGLYMVRPDEVAVEQRFGRIVRRAVPPGLHYRWPYPLGRVRRVRPNQVRAVELGFRTAPAAPITGPGEPTAYEWNIQHRSGRYRKVPEETVVLSGDENMVEINAVVHYTVRDAAKYLFSSIEVDGIVRAVCESSLRGVMEMTPADAVMTEHRNQVEAETLQAIRDTLASYDLGVAVHHVWLQDVHPPVEVVDAYRDVASAYEEKETMINQAEAYANEKVPQARGQAAADIASAQAYRIRREQRATGESARFTKVSAAARVQPQVTRIRLYLQTVESVLAPLKKVILDHHSGGRRHLLLAGPKDLKVDAAALSSSQVSEFPPIPPE